MASPTALVFDGSNGEELVRLATLARLAFLQDPDAYGSARAQCAYLASHFRGPALDWAGLTLSTNEQLMTNFSTFYNGVRGHFGVTDDHLEANRRWELENLRWQNDLPVFFAEFDRLTQLLSLAGDMVKIALVTSKMPTSVRKLLADQALNFTSYSVLRGRLLDMWALDPNRSVAGTPVQPNGRGNKKKQKCNNCGKKGHAASDCRSKN